MEKQKVNEPVSFLLSIEPDGKDGLDASIRLQGKIIELVNMLVNIYDNEPQLKKVLSTSITVHNQLLEEDN